MPSHSRAENTDQRGLKQARSGKFAKEVPDLEAAAELAAQLQDEGAKSFVKSWNELMACIESKSSAIKKAG
jgi:hypothetical protein